MITGSEEYKQFLASIASSYNPPTIRMRVPTEEPIYKIDLNSRSVEAPEILGVEADHEADLVYFIVDRFFDSVDLSSCICMVQFRNAKHEEYYYIIPYYDTDSIRGKMIFTWDIQSPVTKYAGVVQFSFKFFRVSPASGELLYELNTMVAKSRVLLGWANKNGANHNYSAGDTSILVDNDLINNLQQLLEIKNEITIKWIDAV